MAKVDLCLCEEIWKGDACPDFADASRGLSHTLGFLQGIARI